MKIKTLLKLLTLPLLALPLLSCKKKEEVKPSAPSTKDYLSGSGKVKYWQPVSIIHTTQFGGTNLFLTSEKCAVDNYVVFFDNGDYEERAAGSSCFADERLIVNSYTWSATGKKFNIKGINGFSIYEITSTLFGSEVTITELNATRFKGYRSNAPGDTIKFVLSAVPM